MSRAITCTDVDRSLAEVDARTQGLEESGSGDIAVGPFGVLKIDAAPRETPSPHDSVLGPCQSAMVDPRPNEDMPSFEVPNNDIAISNETQTVPSVVDWFDPILGFNNTLHWADLFGLDFDSGNSLIMPQQPLIQPDFYLDNFLPESIPEQPPVSLPIHSQQPPEDPPLYTAEGLPQTEAVTIVEQEERYSIILSEVKSATEAQFLLKHFHDAVIHQMSFMPSGSKSPWTILQLPEAMRSLSELTYLHSGQLKHANMANLYGLMACSAYHLAATHTTLSDESPEYWMDLLERLKAKAKLHMQISLRDELKGDRKAKYKDQLMAILSMLALTVSWIRIFRY
jgi:arginine metabolism regulation protein II